MKLEIQNYAWKNCLTHPDIQNYDVARVELSIYSAEYLSLELIKSKELLYTLPSNNTWKALGSGDDRC